MKFLIYILASAILFAASCKSGAADDAAAEEVVPQTPVSVTSISFDPLTEFIEVNATSAYLQKSIIKASMNGYIQVVNAQKGRFAGAGATLFTLITKEARAIGNTINKLDPNFKFTGITTIKASQSGYCSDLNHQKGDYVTEGEQLAVISDRNSFVFLADVPYEQSGILRSQKNVELLLPDGKRFSGYVTSVLSAVDSASQTQRFAIHPNTIEAIPEGLIAKIRIVKTSKPHAPSLPKAAILTNETEEEFWVMKLINDSTAVKVPINKGIELNDRVEIISPAFGPKDRIITTGNYGLADTAKIKVTKD